MLPSFRLSPQPGLTYYFSAITYYLQILCFELFGNPKGSTEKSRIVVYIRDERIAGAKTSNDTLSTLFNALLGRRQPSVAQPSMF